MITTFHAGWFRLACILGVCCSTLATIAAGTDPRSEGTLAMIDRIRGIDERMDPMFNAYESARRAALFEAELAAATDPYERLKWMQKHALERLNAGESLRAVTAFQELAEYEKQFPDHPRSEVEMTQLLLATSWLRVGEQENCITNHTTDSCLLPIQGNGVHRLKHGSEQAYAVLTSLLERSPDRLDAMWLLNIAAMTLGTYPEGVPERWRVPPDRFQSDYDIKKFTDVAGELGVDGNAISGGTVLEDFNNDGHLDILFSAFGLTDQIRLYLSDGRGGFVERTKEAGLDGLTGGLNMIQADYNNDGWTDVLVLRGAWLGRTGRIPNSLLRNNGDGTFSDVTMEAGLTTSRPTQTAVFFDYNGDGWLDLFIGNESMGSERHRCELFLNNRDGTFEENSFNCGIAIFEMVKGVTSGDFNNDGRPDLYLSILGNRNILLRNDGPASDESADSSKWVFTDVAAEAGVEQPIDSFPTWFFDFDNDGWEDLLVCSYDLTEMDESVASILRTRQDGATMKLYRNLGNGTFDEVSGAMHLNQTLLAMGVNYGDLDNDGWLDFYVGTGNPDLRALVPNKMFRNDKGTNFQDVTTSGGFGHLQKGHAIAFGDLDLDGDQDVCANMGGAYTGDVYRNALFENPGHGNHWIKLKLAGTRSNRSAIGARIKLVLSTPDGERTLHRTVSSGGSFGANPLRQEVGLGNATAIKRVEVTWPATGKRETWTGLPLDSIVELTEDDKTAKQLDLKPTPFRPAMMSGHEHHH